MAPGVARNNSRYALGLLVDGVQAPETASAKYKSFHALFNGPSERMIPSLAYVSLTTAARQSLGPIV
jgi:hypothetical protein